MGLRSAALTLKQKLVGGDHKIHNYEGLLSLNEMDLLRKAAMEQSYSSIKGWLDSGKISLLESILVSWKVILLKYYEGKESFLNKFFINFK
jgi:hypothetical protein